MYNICISLQCSAFLTRISGDISRPSGSSFWFKYICNLSRILILIARTVIPAPVHQFYMIVYLHWYGRVLLASGLVSTFVTLKSLLTQLAYPPTRPNPLAWSSSNLPIFKISFNGQRRRKIIAKIPWHQNIKFSLWSFCRFVFLSFCLFVFLCICFLSFYLFIYLYFFFLSFSLFVYLFICLFVFSSLRLEITPIKFLRGFKSQKSLFGSKL